MSFASCPAIFTLRCERSEPRRVNPSPRAKGSFTQPISIPFILSPRRHPCVLRDATLILSLSKDGWLLRMSAGTHLDKESQKSRPQNFSPISKPDHPVIQQQGSPTIQPPIIRLSNKRTVRQLTHPPKNQSPNNQITNTPQNPIIP